MELIEHGCLGSRLHLLWRIKIKLEGSGHIYNLPPWKECSASPMGIIQSNWKLLVSSVLRLLGKSNVQQWLPTFGSTKLLHIEESGCLWNICMRLRDFSTPNLKHIVLKIGKGKSMDDSLEHFKIKFWNSTKLKKKRCLLLNFDIDKPRDRLIHTFTTLKSGNVRMYSKWSK